MRKYRHLPQPDLDQIIRGQDRIELLLKTLIHRIKTMSDATDTAIAQLQADVSALATAEASAIALLNGLAQQLKDAIAGASNAGATPTQLAALSELHATLQQNIAGLAAAVTADTPVATPPPPPVITIGEVPTITGTAPFSVSGALSANGGQGPYSFVATGDVPGVTFGSGGSFSGLITDAFTGSVSVVATDANGVASAPQSVGFLISAAPAGDDTLTGPAGDDTLTTPTGDDSIVAPVGDDTLDAGTGNDKVSAKS